MEKINFSNGEKISAAKVTINNVDYEVTPAVYDGATPLNATVFNNMQENIEDAINTKADSEDVYEKTETYTKIEVDNLIPTKAHQINVGEDTDYRVNILKTKNLFKGFILGAYNTTTGIFDSSNNQVLASEKIKVKSGKTYTLSGFTANSAVRIFQWNDNAFTSTSVITTATSNQITAVGNYLAFQTGISTTYSNVQIEEGSTEYTPFINNQINVDNEKYSDTINVGTTEDSRSRVNVLKSKNLFGFNYTETKANVTSTYNNSTLTLNGTANAEGFNISTPPIPMVTLEAGTYTISARKVSGTKNGVQSIVIRNSTTNTNIINQSLTDDCSYNFTLTATTTISVLVYQNNNSFSNYTTNIQIEKGDTATDFESYIVPSIKVDNEEIYRKPEIGTNENGSYIKYANGLMICSGVKSFTGANFTTQNGAVYIPASSPSINFAQQFIENPVVTLTAFNRANGVYESGLSTSLVAIWPFAFSSISNVNYSIHYIAIGRWK